MAVRIAAAIIIAALILGSAVYIKPWAKRGDNAPVSKEEVMAAHESMAKFDLNDAKSKKPVTKEELDTYLKSIPEVIAEIGGEPIGNSEYVRAMTGVVNNMTQGGAQVPSSTFERMKKSLYENIVNTITLDRHAIKNGFKADNTEVEKALANFKKRYPSEEVFQQEMDKYNSSEAQLKKEIERSFRVKALIDRDVISGITISDDKAEKYYNDNKKQFTQKAAISASHILVATAQKDSDEKKAEARKKAEDLLKRARGGEDFAKLARESSDDKASAARDGDLGFFSKGMMVPPFEEAAFNMKEGEISDIVETPFGFHIIKLTGKRDEGLQPFLEVKDRVMQQLKSMETSAKIQTYIKELKKKMNVKTFLKDLA